MKKIMEKAALSLLLLVLFAACREDLGTLSGSDSTPVATIYQYAAGSGYNFENDCCLRVVTNSAVKETYYLAELKSAKEDRKMTDEQYAEYVVKNGTKLDVEASNYKDFYITGLYGSYVVTVVAVNGGTRTLQTTSFDGSVYKPLGTGTYTSSFFGDTRTVNVEYSEVGNRYRIVDNWSAGHGFSFSPNGSKVTLYPQTISTGIAHPNYTRFGVVSVTDQGSTYDAASKTFTFSFKFSVSAGSFGVKTETLVLN